MNRGVIRRLGCSLFLLGFTNPSVYSQQIQFASDDLPPIKINPAKDSGLDALYVLYDASNSKLKYEAHQIEKLKIFTFSNLGGNFSTPVEHYTQESNIVTIENIVPDSGYIFEDGDKTYYIWIIDYSKNKFNISSINLSSDNSCDATILDFSGNASPIYYYTINGRQINLSRDIILTYHNLQFDDENFIFNETTITKNIPYIYENISVNTPVLCTTEFIIEGDRFLKEWNESITYETDSFQPIATEVKTRVNIEDDETNEDDSSNQISIDNNGLGGSAPCTISFQAFVSDAVIHNEWQMSSDEEFNDITYRINQQDFTYTFTSEGTVYVRFIGSNSDGSCQDISETYSVTIGASELRIPNAFSPNGDGINDIWKVSYRSLLDFKCWIFNRHGQEVFSFNDPSQGWDGTVNGKTVKSGVYFYVIQATGSDGKKYKKSGDINIIKSKSNLSASDSDI